MIPMVSESNDIKLVPLGEFLDPCQDRSDFFLTRKEIDAQKSGFYARLLKKGSDNAFNEKQRNAWNSKELECRYDFVHRISYNKAVGYISRRDKIPLYNGSSFNRKVDPYSKPCHHVSEDLTDQELEYLEEKKILDAYWEFKNTPGYGLKKHDLEGERLAAKELAKKDKKHCMSKRTKDKIQDKMLAMYRACSNRLSRKGYRAGRVCFTLCTLTFIGDIEDQKGMDLLNNFLTAIKYRYGKMNYISVTERQEVNVPFRQGRIHFHILFDLKLPINYINSLWVKQQIEAGICNRPAEAKLMAATGKTFPEMHTAGRWSEVQQYLNPVDIDKVETIDGVSCYLTKYVTKNEGSFDCSVWSCSNSVSQLFTSTTIDWHKFQTTMDPVKNQITSKAGFYKNKTGQKQWRPEKTHISEPYYGQYCTVSTIYNKSRYKYLMQDLEDINRFILDQHSKSHPKKINPLDVQEKLYMGRNIYQSNYTIVLPAEYN
jgi:hypothetical protein